MPQPDSSDLRDSETEKSARRTQISAEAMAAFEAELAKEHDNMVTLTNPYGWSISFAEVDPIHRYRLAIPPLWERIRERFLVGWHGGHLPY